MNHSVIRLVAFDVDDTLAESFAPPSHSMIEKLSQLLSLMPLAIVSAAGFDRIRSDFLDTLAFSPQRERLYVFPNSGAQALKWQDGDFVYTYSLLLTEDEKSKIRNALAIALREIDEDPRALIIDRDAQIAYAAIGLNATLLEKRAWDPDQSKRRRLVQKLAETLKEFEVLIGGMTTIDITRKGIHKGYALEWLSQNLHIRTSEMLYVGDSLHEGGNDFVVIKTGVQTKETSGPSETEVIIDALLVEHRKHIV